MDRMKLLFLLSFVAVGQCVPQRSMLHVPKKTADKPVGDPLMCILCTDVMKQMKEAMADNKLQKDVEDGIMNGLCPLLPGKAGEKCRSGVERFGPMVFELFSTKMDPRTFCEGATMCEGPPPKERLAAPALQSVLISKLIHHLVPKTGYGASCDLCSFTAKLMTGAMFFNVTEGKLTKLLRWACSVLPSTLHGPCESFLHEHEPVFIKMIEQETNNPGKVCTFLDYCPAVNMSGETAGAVHTSQGGEGQDTSLRFRPSAQI